MQSQTNIFCFSFDLHHNQITVTLIILEHAHVHRERRVYLGKIGIGVCVLVRDIICCPFPLTFGETELLVCVCVKRPVEAQPGQQSQLVTPTVPGKLQPAS